MTLEILRIFVPFLIALFEVTLAAVVLGMLPAFWTLGSARRYGTLGRWIFFTALLVAIAGYWLAVAHVNWPAWTGDKGTKKVALWLGYFVGVIFAPMLLPEPLRQARKLLREERNAPHGATGEPERIKVKRKRRTHERR